MNNPRKVFDKNRKAFGWQRMHVCSMDYLLFFLAASIPVTFVSILIRYMPKE